MTTKEERNNIIENLQSEFGDDFFTNDDAAKYHETHYLFLIRDEIDDFLDEWCNAAMADEKYGHDEDHNCNEYIKNTMK